MPFKISMQKESREFLRVYPEGTEVDYCMVFQPVGSLSLPEEGHWENDRLYVEDEKQQAIYHCPVRGLSPYACVIWPEGTEKKISCNYIRNRESYINYSHNLCDLIGLETFLLKQQGILLHASFIRWKGRGILFSAPSGTGKSTQAELWKMYEKAEIVNGDRAGIRRREQGWMAYGLPLAGSSCIYRNESAPLSGIVVLRQASENRIRRLAPAEAFRCLYPETTVHQWNRQWVEKVSGLLFQLIGETPIWLLECRPDAESVKLLKNTI